MNSTTPEAAGQPKIPVQFAAVPEWILNAHVPDGAVRLFAKLAKLADFRTWRVRKISLDRLAEWLGRSVVTVRKYLGRLREIGALTWAKGGFGATNEYTLHMRRRVRQRELAFDVDDAMVESGVFDSTREATSQTHQRRDDASTIEHDRAPGPPVGESRAIAKGNPVHSQCETPVSPSQTVPQKSGGTPPPSSGQATDPEQPKAIARGNAKRFARQFVDGVRKATSKAGIAMAPVRRRDLARIAREFREWQEPPARWAEVWWFWWKHRQLVNPFKAGCLIDPVQFAQQLGRLMTDAQTHPAWHEWQAGQRRKGGA